MNGDGQVVLQRVGNTILIPVHGPITDEMLQALRRGLLALLQRAGARGVVFDMSGVEVMDADDFARLRQVAISASLMGATVMLAEMQPGVAAGLVLLDADISWARSARTVERAMEALKGA
ncbi:MAG TPA: STAS domain-containing protein [Polyangiaceae bacterium]